MKVKWGKVNLFMGLFIFFMTLLLSLTFCILACNYSAKQMCWNSEKIMSMVYIVETENNVEIDTNNIIYEKNEDKMHFIAKNTNGEIIIYHYKIKQLKLCQFEWREYTI